MKYPLPLLLAISTLSACLSAGSVDKTYRNSAKPGTLVSADSMDIAEDKLNNHLFAVYIYTNDSSQSGSYDIHMTWGYNSAMTTIRMPYGGEDFEPIIRRAQQAYTYQIGFHFNDDTTFQEYYQVEGNRGQIKARYTRSYTLQ